MKYSFGDVVYAEVFYTNLTSSKKRPLVVVNSKNYQDARGDIIVVPITSQIKLKKELKEFEIKFPKTTGLTKKSAIKAVVLTLDASLIKDRIGSLAAADKKSLAKMLNHAIGT
jgi:mRNA-degrading endonuclease toxin of MazEF toxin-antitoxin module